MAYFRTSWRAMVETMRNTFRKPTTVQYPKEDRIRPERYRSSFALVYDDNEEEACIGCLACERICPSRIIKVVASKKRESPATGKRRAYADDFVLDLNACIYCELCVQVCPTDAIVMLRVPQKAAFSREELCLTMDKLYENGKKEVAWGTASRLAEMQDPRRGQPKKAKKKKVAKKKATAKKPEAAAKSEAGAKPEAAAKSEVAAEPKAEAGSKPAAEAKPDEVERPAVEAKPAAAPAKPDEPSSLFDSPLFKSPVFKKPGTVDVPKLEVPKPQGEQPSDDEGGDA